MIKSTRESDREFVNELLQVHYKIELSTNRARLARLRRGYIRRDLDYSVLQDLPVLPDEEKNIELYILIASLFALNPGQGVAPGMALRHLRAKLNNGETSLDRRVGAILSSKYEDLPYRLRQLIQLLKSHDITLDYYRLLRDLKAWNSPKRRVQRTWARAYYAR